MSLFSQKAILAEPWTNGCVVRGDVRRKAIPRLGPQSAIELLEARQLLTTITVTRLDDVVGSGDGVTLREALQSANTNTTVDGVTGSAGQDIIVFAPGLTGTLLLTQGALQITETVTIRGSTLSNTIIDAQAKSRVIDISSTAGDVTLENLDIRNGRTFNLGEDGGGIRSLSPGSLQLTSCTVAGNSAVHDGGGIYTAGSLTLNKSTVSGNSTTLPNSIRQWVSSAGGNDHYYQLVMPDSYLSSFTWTDANTAASGATYLGSAGHLVAVTSSGENDFLGQTFSDQLTYVAPPGNGPTDSTFAWIGLFAPTPSGAFQWVTNESFSYTDWASTEPNFFGDPRWQYVHYWTRDSGWTWNNDANAGYGVTDNHNRYGYIVEYEGPFDSSLSSDQRGGGVAALDAITLIDSTVSGNSAVGSGGGIYGDRLVELKNSTIANNQSGIDGGGVFAKLVLIAHNSIVAKNSDVSGHPDIRPGTTSLSVQSSLIGNNLGTALVAAAVGTPDAQGNLIGTNTVPIDPLLGPLANNGGPTKTHALLPGSPALNAGKDVLADPNGLRQWTTASGGNGHYYQLVMPSSSLNSFSWTDAAAAAAASTFAGSQGHLVTVTSSGENAFLQQQYESQLRLFGLPGDGATDSKSAWIGLYAKTQTANFEWVTGEPVSYTNWASSEPNFQGTPLWPYVHYWTKDSIWSWNNEQDSGYAVQTNHNRYGYIVEFDGPFNPPANSVPATDQRGTGYKRIYGKAVDMGAFEFQPQIPNSIGVFRNGGVYEDVNRNGAWNGNSNDAYFIFGNPTDIPITGDWNGDGKTDIGTFRNGTFYLDLNGSRKWEGASDVSFVFGIASDIPITGDWNGDGKTDVGIFRSGRFYLDLNGSRKWESASDVSFLFGNPTDIPITGDWNGDGKWDVGTFRSGTFFLDQNGSRKWEGVSDISFRFGNTTDLPTSGDWNSDGKWDVGTFRSGVFYIDQNGNHKWDNASDLVYRFGNSTDKPIVGSWGSVGASTASIVSPVPVAPSSASMTAAPSWVKLITRHFTRPKHSRRGASS
ncbi:MAG: choice-of-anchor Q domain-containing protein [Planctomycetales bacterium]